MTSDVTREKRRRLETRDSEETQTRLKTREKKSRQEKREEKKREWRETCSQRREERRDECGGACVHDFERLLEKGSSLLLLQSKYSNERLLDRGASLQSRSSCTSTRTRTRAHACLSRLLTLSFVSSPISSLAVVTAATRLVLVRRQQRQRRSVARLSTHSSTESV